MNYISIYFLGKIYNIEKDPYEINDDAYKRGWFIVKNFDKYENYDELISLSKMNIYKKNDMVY